MLILTVCGNVFHKVMHTFALILDQQGTKFPHYFRHKTEREREVEEGSAAAAFIPTMESL